MKRLILALLATAVATPAIAQHAGHNMPGMTMPEEKAEPKRKPAAKKKAPAKKKATAKKPAAKGFTKACGKAEAG